MTSENVATGTIKAHGLSVPMLAVMREVAASRGIVGAWAMSNVILHGIKGATKATVTALIKRGILFNSINEGDASGTGGFHDYILTGEGLDLCKALGYPVTLLPLEEEEITALVEGATQDDCETGCETLIARGVALLPVGGDVCVGCGSVFTRPTGQQHPSLYKISEAVVARNNVLQVGDVIVYKSGPWYCSTVERFDGEHVVMSMSNLSNPAPVMTTILTSTIVEQISAGTVERRRKGN